MIREHGPALAEMGYPLCALTPGAKAPMQKAWGSHPLSAGECRNFRPENAGIGVICGVGETAIYGLDFDIPGDFECAEAMRERAMEILGDEAVYRIGMPPKFLIPVFGAEGHRKVTTPWFTKDGNDARFEFLGKGQQFVVEAVHPDTGAPYEWYGEPLMGDGTAHLPIPSFLPRIDEERLVALQKAFKEIAEAHGWRLKDSDGRTLSTGALFEESGSDDFLQATDAELTPHNPLGLTLAEAERYLEDFPGVDSYDTWLQVGMALHHEFSGSAEALSLWDKWSSKAANYQGFSDLEHRWDGFGRNTGAPKTMAFIVKEYNETHYDDAAELTETGRAYRLLEWSKGNLRFAVDTDTWYKWGGTHWETLYSAEIEALGAYATGELLRADLRKMAKRNPEATKALNAAYKTFRKSSAVPAIVRAAERLSGFHCRSTDFDSDSRYFGVANGDIDLETGELLAPDPDRKTAHYSTVAYDKDAKCPLWLKTLSDVFAGRPEMAPFIQRVFGYALLGDPAEEKIFIFHGCGSNGKSTVLNTVRQVFGSYSVTMEDTTVTAIGKSSGGNAGGSRSDILALKGKRLALVPETEDGAAMRESTVKRLVSLDAITARGTYERNMTTFTPTAVPILSTNYMPDIKGTDDGIWRRVVAVSFKESFEGRKDTGRQAALKKELPGILNWLIEGALEYQKNGLGVPEEVRCETSGLRSDMDVIQAWISECCDVGDPQYVLPSSDALCSWKAWAQRNSCEFKMTPQRLGRLLHGKGIQASRVSVGGKRVRCFTGIRLSDEFQNLEEV